MTVALRSLRITAEMDSSSYARGAQQKVAADAAMIASGDRFGASLATADISLQKLPAGMARLSRMWISGYSETEKFEKAIRQVGNAIDKGMNLDRAVTMLKAIETQFGRTANAAQLAKQGFVSVGPALATAQVDQSGLNSLLGMKSGSGRSAQDSAAVFLAAAAEQESMAASAKALRAEIDPLGTAQARLNAELLEYRALANAGVISTGELAVANQMATTRFGTLAQNIEATGKSGGLARHQIQNLSFQLNDVATMLASGQAPFTLFMQQGMQIGQLLGPQGLQAGVKSLGLGIVSFLTNPVNLAVLGFAGLAAGATYAFKAINNGGDDVEDSLKKQKELLDELRDSYKAIGREVAAVSPQNALVVEIQARLDVANTAETLRKEMSRVRDLLAFTAEAAGARNDPLNIFGYFLPSLGDAGTLRSAMEDVEQRLLSGRISVEDFRNEWATFADMNRENAAIQLATKSLFEMTKQGSLAERQLTALKFSLDFPFEAKIGKLFAGNANPLELLGGERQNRNLNDFLPDNRSQQQQLQDSYSEFLKKVGQGPDSLMAIGAANRIVAETQAAWNAELGKTVALGNLELQSIYAKSPAQKALIAGERERISAINTGIDADELNIRVQHASALAYQEATFEIKEQNRARLVSANDNIANARLELELIGASAAKQAELRANLGSYLDLKRQAESNGLAFDQAYYELLKGQNRELGLLAELTARKNLANELDTERRYLGMSPREADIEKQLRGKGIELGTQEAQGFHDEMLAMKEFQDSMFYGFKTGFDDIRSDANDFASSTKAIVTDLYGGMEDALVEFVKTGKVNFQSLTDQMIEDVTRLAYKLAMSGILNMLIGGSAQNTSGYGGILGNMFKTPSLYGKGDIFDGPTAFGYGNGKMGVMAEDGPEAVVPLRRGRDGKLGIAGGSGGSNVTILPTVYNNSGKVTARSEVKDQGNGRFELNTFVEDIVVETLAGHKGQSIMSGIYGVGRQVRSR